MHPIIHPLLSKLGFNHNMKRHVVFDPVKYGSSNKIHFHTEQGIFNLEALVGHLRMHDNIRSLYLIEFQCFQLLLINSETPFYDLDPSKYAYGEKCTCQFLWYFLDHAQLSMTLTNFWTLPKHFQNDVYLMDVFVQRYPLL